MTLRDYFAAKAMAALVVAAMSSGDAAHAANVDAKRLGLTSPEWAAHRAYQAADAMLEARK